MPPKAERENVPSLLELSSNFTMVNFDFKGEGVGLHPNLITTMVHFIAETGTEVDFF